MLLALTLAVGMSNTYGATTKENIAVDVGVSQTDVLTDVYTYNTLQASVDLSILSDGRMQDSEGSLPYETKVPANRNSMYSRLCYGPTGKGNLNYSRQNFINLTYLTGINRLKYSK